MDLETAQKNTVFPILLPEKIPGQFQLQYVTVIKKESDEKSKEIYLHYKGENRSFTIYEKIFKEAIGIGQIVDREDSSVGMTMVNGLEGCLITYKDDTLKLSWVDQNHYYSISGQLTKKEIIEIAESM